MNGLYTWQEPFRPYLEKNVLITLTIGEKEIQIRGKMLDPLKKENRNRYSMPKFGKMKIRKENGKVILLSIERIKLIQEVDQ